MDVFPFAVDPAHLSGTGTPAKGNQHSAGGALLQLLIFVSKLIGTHEWQDIAGFAVSRRGDSFFFPPSQRKEKNK
jgi:hypothetical protein